MINSLLASMMRDVVQSPDLVLKNVLAAAGGALIGALCTGLFTMMLFKAVHVRRPPRVVVMGLSVMGGVIIGWVVWIWVCSTSGHGPGPGGMAGTGASVGTSGTTGTPISVEQPSADIVRVAIVRGPDYEAESRRYYLVEGRKPAHTLEETLQILKERKDQQPGLGTVEVVIYQDSITEVRGFVAELEDAVKARGFAVKTFKPGTESP